MAHVRGDQDAGVPRFKEPVDIFQNFGGDFDDLALVGGVGRHNFPIGDRLVCRGPEKAAVCSLAAEADHWATRHFQPFGQVGLVRVHLNVDHVVRVQREAGQALRHFFPGGVRADNDG